MHLFQRGDRRKKVSANVILLEGNEDLVIELIGEANYLKLLEDIEVLDSLISEPDVERIQQGEQTPLFFGSAMTNFGVELFLKTFLNYARRPAARAALVETSTGGTGEENDGLVFTTTEGGAIKANEDVRSGGDIARTGIADTSSNARIEPENSEFTGFVFKLQANLDPKHRDRMAFIRVCSGENCY